MNGTGGDGGGGCGQPDRSGHGRWFGRRAARRGNTRQHNGPSRHGDGEQSVAQAGPPASPRRGRVAPQTRDAGLGGPAPARAPRDAGRRRRPQRRVRPQREHRCWPTASWRATAAPSLRRVMVTDDDHNIVVRRCDLPRGADVDPDARRAGGQRRPDPDAGARLRQPGDRWGCGLRRRLPGDRPAGGDPPQRRRLRHRCLRAGAADGDHRGGHGHLRRRSRDPPRPAQPERARDDLPLRARADDRLRHLDADRDQARGHRHGRRFGRRQRPGARHHLPLPARRHQRRRHDQRAGPHVRYRGCAGEPARHHDHPGQDQQEEAQGEVRVRRLRRRRRPEVRVQADSPVAEAEALAKLLLAARPTSI